MDAKEGELAAVCETRRVGVIGIGKIHSQYQSQECLLVTLLGIDVHQSNNQNTDILGAIKTGGE